MENPPEYPGGMPAFYQFISKELKYPKDARKNKVQGKIFVEFIIEKDGSILPENVSVLKGVYESLDNEAVRVIRLSPKWIPAQQRGMTVRCRMVFPIVFSL